MAVVVALILGGTWLADLSTTAGASARRVAAAGGVSGNSCRGVFNGKPPGSLVETTSAGSDNSAVAPGQTVTVTLTWSPSDFGGAPLSKTDDCVEIGAQISAALSQEHKPGPADGTDTFTFTVPNGTAGQPICTRSAISGPMSSTEKSHLLCYTILAVATPEAPVTLLFPVVGFLLGGGGFLYVRQRRRARTRTSASSPLTR